MKYFRLFLKRTLIYSLCFCVVIILTAIQKAEAKKEFLNCRFAHGQLSKLEFDTEAPNNTKVYGDFYFIVSRNDKDLSENSSEGSLVFKPAIKYETTSDTMYLRLVKVEEQGVSAGVVFANEAVAKEQNKGKYADIPRYGTQSDFDFKVEVQPIQIGVGHIKLALIYGESASAVKNADITNFPHFDVYFKIRPKKSDLHLRSNIYAYTSPSSMNQTTTVGKSEIVELTIAEIPPIATYPSREFAVSSTNPPVTRNDFKVCILPPHCKEVVREIDEKSKSGLNPTTHSESWVWRFTPLGAGQQNINFKILEYEDKSDVTVGNPMKKIGPVFQINDKNLSGSIWEFSVPFDELFENVDQNIELQISRAQNKNDPCNEIVEPSYKLNNSKIIRRLAVGNYNCLTIGIDKAESKNFVSSEKDKNWDLTNPIETIKWKITPKSFGSCRLVFYVKNGPAEVGKLEFHLPISNPHSNSNRKDLKFNSSYPLEAFIEKCDVLFWPFGRLVFEGKISQKPKVLSSGKFLIPEKTLPLTFSLHHGRSVSEGELIPLEGTENKLSLEPFKSRKFKLSYTPNIYELIPFYCSNYKIVLRVWDREGNRFIRVFDREDFETSNTDLLFKVALPVVVILGMFISALAFLANFFKNSSDVNEAREN